MKIEVWPFSKFHRLQTQVETNKRDLQQERSERIELQHLLASQRLQVEDSRQIAEAMEKELKSEIKMNQRFSHNNRALRKEVKALEDKLKELGAN